MVYIVLISFVISLGIARLLSIFTQHNKGLILLPSVLISTLCAILLLNVFGVQEITVLKLSTFFIFIGACAIYLCGILFDYKHLSISGKTLMQGLTACCFPAIGLYVNDMHGLFGISTMPVWVSYVLTFGLIILMTTSLSSLNKIKGLATGYSMVVTLAFALYYFFFGHRVFVLLATTMAGTLMVMYHLEMWSGFRTKKRPFVGTAGILILGFTVSYLALKAGMNTALHPDTEGQGFLTAIALLFLPCADVLISWIIKALDNGHGYVKDFDKALHHLLYKKGFRNARLVGLYVCCMLLCLTLSVSLYYLHINFTIIFLADCVLIALQKVFFVSIKVQPQDEEAINTVKNIEKIWELQEGKSYTRPDLTKADIKISIIVATYNSGATIADTFNSILAQTYPNYEVVLCDGCSTDNTLEIVTQYQALFGDKLVAVSEADKGIYDAMNKGIDRATGDIIGILNSDDFYTHKNVLERIANTFKLSPLLEAVYGDVHYVKPSDLQRTVRYYSSKHFRPRYMRLGFMPAHPSFYCLKELYSTYGKYSLDYKVAADFDQLFRLLFIHRIRAQYMNMDFVTMRTGGASSSGIKSHLQIMKDHTKTMHSYGLSVSYFLFGIRYLYKCLSIGSGKISRFFSA